MIYVDTSVALAHLFAEDRRPAASFWTETLVSSRLLEYEIWTRLHARKATASRAEAAQGVIARVSLLELAPLVLSRALEPFPVSVRTLDALHLASCQFLRDRSQGVELATYDRRMADASRALGIPLRDLG